MFAFRMNVVWHLLENHNHKAMLWHEHDSLTNTHTKIPIYITSTTSQMHNNKQIPVDESEKKSTYR